MNSDCAIAQSRGRRLLDLVIALLVVFGVGHFLIGLVTRGFHGAGPRWHQENSALRAERRLAVASQCVSVVLPHGVSWTMLQAKIAIAPPQTSAENRALGMVTRPGRAHQTHPHTLLDHGMVLRNLPYFAAPNMIVAVDRLTMPLRRNDQLLACTDGLYNVVDDDELGSIIRGTDAGEASRRLIELANRRGTADNSTGAIFTSKADAQPARLAGAAAWRHYSGAALDLCVMLGRRLNGFESHKNSMLSCRGSRSRH